MSQTTSYVETVRAAFPDWHNQIDEIEARLQARFEELADKVLEGRSSEVWAPWSGSSSAAPGRA